MDGPLRFEVVSVSVADVQERDFRRDLSTMSRDELFLCAVRCAENARIAIPPILARIWSRRRLIAEGEWNRRR